jgi:hypothetical protein
MQTWVGREKGMAQDNGYKMKSEFLTEKIEVYLHFS